MSVRSPKRGTRMLRSRVERLYDDYAGRIYGYCLSRLDSPEEAEDALQATYLNAWRSLNSGVEPLLGRPWLFQIAANVCSSMLRTRLQGSGGAAEPRDVRPHSDERRTERRPPRALGCARRAPRAAASRPSPPGLARVELRRDRCRAGLLEPSGGDAPRPRTRIGRRWIANAGARAGMPVRARCSRPCPCSRSRWPRAVKSASGGASLR